VKKEGDQKFTKYPRSLGGVQTGDNVGGWTARRRGKSFHSGTGAEKEGEVGSFDPGSVSKARG